MHEKIAGCVLFHGMRHTGENIRKETGIDEIPGHHFGMHFC